MRNACASIFFGAMVALVSASVVADNKVRFNRDVLPILAENCYACHGADEASREADFRLDKRDLVILDRDGTHAIVPGRPEKSELWNRIVCRDLQRVMPPTKSSRQLNDAQREVLCRWISEGAA